MRKPLIAAFMIAFSLTLYGCDSPALGSANGSGNASAMPDPTLVSRATTGCSLIDSRDLATLLVTAEIVRGASKEATIDRPVFSKQAASTRDSSCIFYAYHKPGSSENTMIQVTYWVDTPDRATPGEWVRVWTEGRPKTSKTVPGVGEDAFYDNGRLTFKKAGIYITLEVLGTEVTTATSEGVAQQLDMEKRLALAALGRLK